MITKHYIDHPFLSHSIYPAPATTEDSELDDDDGRDDLRREQERIFYREEMNRLLDERENNNFNNPIL